MKQQIIEWIANNGATIVDICLPLLKSKKEYLEILDREYHQDVINQYVEKVVSKVCDEVCRDTGCSAEQFYDTIEGTEDAWILHSLD